MAAATILCLLLLLASVAQDNADRLGLAPLQVQHYPYYFTMGKGDYKGNECMRQTYEPLFYQYGVDVSLSGALPFSSGAPHKL
jgi:hypothetical protein